MKHAAPAALTVLALPMLAMTGACTMAPPYRRPPPPVPAAWPGGEAYRAATTIDAPTYAWRDVLADPRLQHIVSAALADNQDVAAALANVAAARASYRIQRAALLPEIDGNGGYTRAGGAASTLPPESFSAGASVSAWEVDLFGRVRSLAAAERARYLGSVAAVRGTRLLLVAEVAQAWIAYGRDASLLAIARDTAFAARGAVKLTARRVDGGIAPLDDQRKAEITLATAEADSAALVTALAQDRNALRLLVGGEIADADLPAGIEDASARLGEVPAGLDSGILLRRPDVTEAEYALKAANADIGAARAAMFPRISLTAAVGVASTALSALFTGGAFTWNAGASASMPIFAAGRVRAGIALARAQRDLALAQYRKAIQSAFREVADQLARRGTIDAQASASRAAAAAAADNARLTDRRYTGGVASYLDSLTAQQTLYTARRAAVATDAARAANLVELYRTLGGDDPVS